MFCGINLSSLDLWLSLFYGRDFFSVDKKAQPVGIGEWVGVRKRRMKDLFTFVLGEKKDAQYENLIFVFYDGEIIMESPEGKCEEEKRTQR
jgi:hypothetical protein